MCRRVKDPLCHQGVMGFQKGYEIIFQRKVMILRKGLRGTLEVSDRDRDPDTHGEKLVLDKEEQVMRLFLIIEWYFTHLDLWV